VRGNGTEVPWSPFVSPPQGRGRRLSGRTGLGFGGTGGGKVLTRRLRKVVSSEARESRNLSHAKDFYAACGSQECRKEQARSRVPLAIRGG